MSEICVVHLVWGPLGPDPFRGFVESYRQNRGGIEHHLRIVFNGFRKDEELAGYVSLLDGLPHSILRMPRATLDIPAYLAAAHATDSRYVCFLNSYSVLLDPDWLAKLHGRLSRPGVGLVGATGSHESLYTTRSKGMRPRGRRSLPRRIAGEWWRRWLLRKHRAFFDPFPNPHVRTNAFMIARETLLRVKTPPIRSKLDAHRFESGTESLTNQVLALQLDARVIGRDGQGYRQEEWPESHTFRSGDQQNLLVADNRTREYQCADAEGRRLQWEMAWGRRGGDSPSTRGQEMV